MIIKKTGFFRFIEGEKYNFICDSCQHQITDSEALRTYANTCAITISAGLISICTKCFNKGINHYRHVDFKNNTSNSNCKICEADLKNIPIYDLNSNVKHICIKCQNEKTHIDNTHHFGYSTDNDIWNSCSNCGTLRLIESNQYKYYKIGNTLKQSSPSKCIKTNINQMLCKHSFIEILDLRKDNKKITRSDVLAADKNLKNALPILKNDPYQIVTHKSVSIAKNGYILQWCSICGILEKKI